MAKTKRTMAGKAVGAAKPKAAAPKRTPKAAPKKSRPDGAELKALKQKSQAATKDLEKAKTQADELREKARQVEEAGKDAFHTAVVPYREACRKAGVECEFSGRRAANVSEKVSFLVEKTDKGLRVMVKGKPKTEEVIPTAALKASVNKAAYAYTDKHVGPREKVGNKGGSLSNRLRAALAMK